MLFDFGDIKLDVDVARTRRYFADAPLLTDDCNCAGCRNYVQAAQKLPREMQDFFVALGLDTRKTPDVYVNGTRAAGLLFYQGWYHICGEILQGLSTSTPENPPHNTPSTPWIQVSDKFCVSFSKKCDLLPDDFPKPAIQMEIWAANIPWVLAEENPYANRLIREDIDPRH